MSSISPACVALDELSPQQLSSRAGVTPGPLLLLPGFLVALVFADFAVDSRPYLIIVLVHQLPVQDVSRAGKRLSFCLWEGPMFFEFFRLGLRHRGAGISRA